MSHIATIQIKITDLAALKVAAAEMGALFVENQKTYKWYGRKMNDSPMPEGMNESDLGKCDHAIKLPGVNYEIGVCKVKDGGYTLAYDEWGHKNYPEHDGHKLVEKFGKGLKKLQQTYAVAKATLTAKAKGYLVKRQNLPNGTIKLTLQQS